jgi:hypothetical protein
LRLFGKEVPDGGGGMAHGDCFVQGKALAPILGRQDVIAQTLTLISVLIKPINPQASFQQIQSLQKRLTVAVTDG